MMGLIASLGSAQAIRMEPVDKNVMFEHLGTMAGVVNMGHLILPINLNVISTTLDEYCSKTAQLKVELIKLKPTKKQSEVTLATQIKRIINSADRHCKMLAEQVSVLKQVWLVPEKASLEEKLKRFQDQYKDQSDLDSLDLHEISPINPLNYSDYQEEYFQLEDQYPYAESKIRTKRQIGIGLGILAATAISAFSTVYSHTQLENLSTQMHRENQFNIKVISEIASRVNINQKALITLKQNMITMTYAAKNAKLNTGNFAVAIQAYAGLNTLSLEVDRILEGLEQLSRHRLSPQLIHPEALEESLKQLQNSMRAEGYKLTTESVFQLFQSEVSHVYFPNGTLNIIIHVPGFRQSELLTLYQLRPMPLKFPGNVQSRYFNPTVSSQFLAVSDDETEFQVFTQKKLQDCSKIFDLYVCHQNNIIDKRINEDCLMSIFQNKLAKVRELCPWERSIEDQAIQINDSAFMVYIAPPKIDQAVVKCPSAEKRFPLEGNNIINLEAGCGLYTESFEMTAATHLYARSPIMTLRTLDPSSLLFPELDLANQADNDQENIIAQLDTIESSTPLTIKEWEQRARDFATSSLTSRILLILFGLALGLGAAGFITWEMRKRKVGCFTRKYENPNRYNNFAERLERARLSRHESLPPEETPTSIYRARPQETAMSTL